MTTLNIDIVLNRRMSIHIAILTIIFFTIHDFLINTSSILSVQSDDQELCIWDRYADKDPKIANKTRIAWGKHKKMVKYTSV